MSELQSKLANADMQAAPRALLRAAQAARKLARQTNTPIVVLRNGAIVEVLVSEHDEAGHRTDVIHDR